MNPMQKLIIFFTLDNSLSDTVKVYLDSVDLKMHLAITDSLEDLNRVLNSGRVVLTLIDQTLGNEIINSTIEIQKKINNDLPLVIITDKSSQEEAAEKSEMDGMALV